jgi:hypothetical protein
VVGGNRYTLKTTFYFYILQPSRRLLSLTQLLFGISKSSAGTIVRGIDGTVICTDDATFVYSAVPPFQCVTKRSPSVFQTVVRSERRLKRTLNTVF